LVSLSLPLSAWHAIDAICCRDGRDIGALIAALKQRPGSGDIGEALMDMAIQYYWAGAGPPCRRRAELGGEGASRSRAERRGGDSQVIPFAGTECSAVFVHALGALRAWPSEGGET